MNDQFLTKVCETTVKISSEALKLSNIDAWAHTLSDSLCESGGMFGTLDWSGCLQKLLK